ncbi:MAG: transposase [Gemmobacter sp.]|jgi:hypothetical protein|nr:transposase [Gemmobacter sp.]
MLRFSSACASRQAGLVLYRLRRQVEPAFKRLKRLLNLDTRRAKDPDLARAWIYANLIAAFLIDDMARPAPGAFPS